MDRMKIIWAFASAMFLTASVYAQGPDRREVRRGNRQFRKGAYSAADISYRKALMQDSASFAANYNLANTLYREEDMDNAGKYLDKLKGAAPGSEHAADYYYNAGDVALQKKDYKAAVDAFHESLLRNPGDLDAKENYIYAREMLKNEQGGGGGENDQNQDQNQQNQQNQQDQQDQRQDENQDQQKEDQPQRQDRPEEPRDELSSQQAQQMLEAIQAKERQTQDKVNKEKAALLKSRQKDKNW